MEPWQNQYINDNLAALVELTTPNTVVEVKLKADRILADVDLDLLRTEREKNGKNAAAKLLFDLLVTRKNSYAAIGKAAFETCQTGTYLILLRGWLEHLLRQSSIVLPKETLENILETELDKKDTFDLFLAHANSSTIFNTNWIPPLRCNFYLSRYISNRIKLKQAVFREKCPDIFVFTGLTRSQLTRLVEPSSTITSTKVIDEENVAAQFVYLEDMEDWEDLCQLYSNAVPPRPAHLIIYEDTSKEYILQKSTQPSSVISKHVPPHLRDKSLYVSEEQFCHQIDTEQERKAICICDSPGMGKTWVLENMARQLKKQNPTRFAAVISLSKFVQHINISPDILNSHFTQQIQLVLNYLCPFRLLPVILGKSLEKETNKLDLFLDGFDEISKEHLQSTKHLLTSIANSCKNIRFFVTSRPHMRKELEETFGANAYDILPFSEENQVNFLVSFWKNNAKQPNQMQQGKLEEFARACIRRLKGALTKEEGDLMGIPLQCFLLAAINLRKAQLYCRPSNCKSADELIDVTTMYGMYSRYMKMGLDKALKIDDAAEIPENKKTVSDSVSECTSCYSKERCANTCARHILKAFHVWKALELLYPEIAEEYFQNEMLPFREPSSEVYACGILQICTANVDDEILEVAFFHRTFAEYLIAEFLAETVTDKCSPADDGCIKKIMSLLVRNILNVNNDHVGQLYRTTFSLHGKDESKPRGVHVQTFSFMNPVITQFLNAVLDNATLSVDSTPDVVAQHITVCLMEDETLPQILSASISSRCVNIIRLLKCTLCKPEIINKQDLLRQLLINDAYLDVEEAALDDHYMSSLGYLNLAAAMSDVKVVTELYSLFEECLSMNLDDICSEISIDVITPLHYAVEKHDYDLTEFFIRRICPQQRGILYRCVQNTTECTHAEVKAAKEICKLVVQKWSVSLFEKYVINNIYGDSPILAPSVNIELIKFLVREGANIRATSSGENILTEKIIPTPFQQPLFWELCQFITLDLKDFDFFRETMVGIQMDVDGEFMKCTDDAILRSIFQMPEIKQYFSTTELIYLLIKISANVEIFKEVVNIGKDANIKKQDLSQYLMWAAQAGNLAVLQYLQSKVLSLDFKNLYGYTLLHYASHHLETIKYLVSQGVNILAVCQNDKNVAHLAAESKGGADILEFLATLNNAGGLFTKLNTCGKSPFDVYFENHEFSEFQNIEGLLKLPGIKFPKETKKQENVFLHAVSSKQTPKVIKLLKENGLDPFVLNKQGQTALHLAVITGDLEVTRYLVLLGLPLDHRDDGGNTPLLLSKENMEVAKYLILQGADPLALDNEANNIAHKFFGVDSLSCGGFSCNGYQDMFKAKNNDGRTPLHHWLASGVPITSEKISKCLVFSNMEVNVVDKNGQTMLMSAVAAKYGAELLNSLIKLGIDINKVDHGGQNVLHIAAGNGNMFAVEYFATRGVSLEQKDNKGYTPLLLAAGNITIIKYLVTKSANVLAVNEEDNNLAHLSMMASRGSEENLNNLAYYLLVLPEGRKLFKMKNQYKRTPLHECIKKSTYYLNIVTFKRILRRFKVSIDEADILGNTMFLSASNLMSWNWKIQKHLLENGADYNVVNCDGDNALHIAIRNQDKVNHEFQHEVVKYLVGVGCNVNHVNNEGLTPLQLHLKTTNESRYYLQSIQKTARILKNAATLSK